MSSILSLARMSALAILVLAGTVYADYTTTLQSLALPNYTSYVVDADATRPGAPGRSVIPAAVTLKYTRSGSTASAAAVDFTLTWSLVNSATGLAHPLDTGGSSLTTTLGVSWTPGVSEVTLTTQVDLDPAVRMDRNSNYRLRVVATPAGGVGTTHEQIPLLFRHFTNTVGNDTAFNLIGTAPFATLNRTWVILGPGVTGPTVSSTVFLERYDDFDLPVASADIPLRLRAQFTDMTDPMNPQDIPQIPGLVALPVLTVANHTADDKPVEAVTGGSLQIDASTLSTGAMSRVTAIFEYQDGDGSYVTLAQRATTPQRFFPMSGVLKFGSTVTRFTDLTGSPQASGGNWELTIPAGKGYLENRPEVTFSASVVVSFDANHDATVISGTAYFPTSFDQIGPEGAKIRIKREGATMTTAGVSATQMTVYFPAGFVASVPPSGVSTPEKNAAGRAIIRDQPLDADLRPTGMLSITPLAVRRGLDPAALDSHGEIFCHHEKLPTWFKASAISLNTTTGAFDPVGLGEWRFVRDTEMTLVEALHQPATDPPLNQSDNRPSNDSHFRNAHLAHLMESKTMGIQADASGVAVLSARLPLGGGQARPHYPLGAGTEAAEGFAFASGVVQIVGGVVDAASSGLSVMELRQSFKPDPESTLACLVGGPAKAGPQSFIMQPVGGVVRFTPELGLIADGTLTAAPLAWGTVDQKGDPEVLNGPPTFRFAQRTVTPFTKGTYYQPGSVLPGAVVASQNDRPGVLLLSGHEKPGAGGQTYLERPVIIPPATTAPYFTDGLANYAGLNLRVSEEPPGMTAKTLMDGTEFGPYPLKSRGKYYLQLAGVTGMHERITTPAPENVTFYKFPVLLDDYKLSYIDNKVDRSLVKGSVQIPFPVGITQAFAELRFNERGQPTSARMPAGPQLHNPGLSHWSGVPFVAHSIGFHPQKSAGPCAATVDSDKGFIEMGTTFTGLAGGILPGTISAVLGFKSVNGRGELTALSDSTPGGLAFGTGIDSRLHLPPNLKIVVPGGGEYTLNPVTRGCFTDSNGATVTSPSGFLSFAGYLAVPFFREIPVHVHLGLAQATPQIHIMGGWSENNQTFFTHPGSFDSTHRGYPQELQGTPLQKLATYRAPPVEADFDLYRPHARKCWMDIVDFNFPLTWNPVSKRFASVRTKVDDLLLFDIDQKLNVLSGSGAEIAFGAELPRLPQFNPQRLAMDVADGVTNGAFSNFSTALANASTQVLHATGITNSINAMNGIITDRVDAVFETALGGAVDVLLNQALGAAESSAAEHVAAGAEKQREEYVKMLKSQLKAFSGLQTALHEAIGEISDVEAASKGLLKEVAAKLKVAREGVRLLRKIIERDPPEDGGKRSVFRNLTSELAFSEPANGILITNGVNYLAKALDNLEEVQEFTENPFFDELDGVLEETEQQIDTFLVANTANEQLGAPLKLIATQILSNNFLNELETKIDEALNRILPPLTSTLRDVAGGDEPGQLRAMHLKQELRRAILDKVQASVLGDKIQRFLKDGTGHIRDVIRDSTDKLLAQIATTVKEGFHEQLGAGVNIGTNPLNGLVDKELPLKQLGEVFQGANLRGYARTVGSSISALRLDGGIKVSPPGMGTGMNFAGYFEFRDNHLEGPPPERCLGVGGDAAVNACQVKAGASFGSKARPNKTADDKEGTSIFDDLNVSLDVQFAFKTDGHIGVLPLGVIGNQNFKGKLDLDIITLREIDMKLNFSQSNQYLLAYADGEIAKILGAKVWIFAGNSCNLLGIKTGDKPEDFLIDRYTKRTLTEVCKFNEGQVAQMAGVMLKTIGEISVNELLKELAEVDIPEDILEVSFNRGYTYFFGVAPAQVGLANPRLIAAMAMFGGMEANFLGVSVGDGDVGISGAVGITSPFAVNEWVNQFPAISGSINGRADFSAFGDLLQAYLDLGGTLSRDGLKLEVNDWDVLNLKKILPF